MSEDTSEDTPVAIRKTWGLGGQGGGVGEGGGREGTGPPTILMHFSLPRGRGEGEVRREGGCPRGLNGGQADGKKNQRDSLTQ